MRFTQFSVLKSLISLTLCSLLISSNLLSGEPVEFEHFSLESRLERFKPDRELDEPVSDNPDERQDWFTFQRTYPNDSVPADARRKAWTAASRIRLESDIEPFTARGWRAIGPSPTSPAFPINWGFTSGRVNAMAVSPSDSRIVLAGSSTGGIWRSSDSGASFTPVSDEQTDLAVGSVVFSKSNPSIVYAGMGDTKLGYLGSGVLKSTNAGRTWRRVSNSTLPSPGTISKLEVDPANPNRVFAAQFSKLLEDKVTSSGFYISTDGGENWSKKLEGAARDIALDPSNSQTIYVGRVRIEKDTDPAGGLYRSTDGGNTWAAVFNLDYDVKKRRDIRVVIAPSNPQTIYAYHGGVLQNNSSQVQFRVSTNGGETWIDRGVSGFDIVQFGYNTYLVADPNDANTVYLGSRDLFRTTDGGVSWTNLTQSFSFDGFGFSYSPFLSKAHPDQHGFAFVPGTPNQFYIGNDGGVYKTTNSGQTFQSLNSTLSLTQFTSIALHPTNPTITYGGTQDNGTQRRFIESGLWAEIASGDGGRVVINPTDPSMVFVTYIRGTIYRFLNDGRFFQTQVGFDDLFGESFANPRIAFYPPFTGNGVDATLYFGTWRLYLSATLGDTWFAPAGDLDLTKGITEKAPDVLSAIGVGRANRSVIYTGSAQGRAMATTDSGITWKDVTQGLPDRSITSIKVDSANSSTAFITFSGFKTGHIFKTTDMGATWQDISSNLPDIPTNTLLIDPLNPNTLYAGTDIGVFRSLSGSTNWQPFNDGLPPVIVQDFSAQSDGLIQLATYGRGAYEIIGNERPSISNVTWNGKKKLTITGRAFDDEARVMINSVDRTGSINSVSDTSITFKKKAKKLGLVDGDNIIQIINTDGVASNAFTLSL